MDSTQASQILESELARYKALSYAELLNIMGQPRTSEVNVPSGEKYQIEVDVFWDDAQEGALRVLGSIDDGGWRALAPLCRDFIMVSDRPTSR